MNRLSNYESSTRLIVNDLKKLEPNILYSSHLYREEVELARLAVSWSQAGASSEIPRHTLCDTRREAGRYFQATLFAYAFMSDRYLWIEERGCHLTAIRYQRRVWQVSIGLEFLIFKIKTLLDSLTDSAKEGTEHRSITKNWVDPKNVARSIG